MSVRPTPPEALLINHHEESFAPSVDLAEWLRSTFIEEDADLCNPDHAHLANATIGCLWTSVSNSRQGRSIIGQCETGEPRGAMGKWSKARARIQVTEWFGDIPDFILTLDANYCAQCSDAEFCALVEHELYHAAQERDMFGQPKFTKEGRPVFGIRGHDVEEFIGVVRRYGAISHEVRALVDAAKQKPEVASISISQACGTCQLRAA